MNATTIRFLVFAVIAATAAFGADNVPQRPDPGSQGGEVLGTLNSTYRTVIGTLDVPAFKVSTGSTEILCYIPPIVDLDAIHVAVPNGHGGWTDMTACELARKVVDGSLDPKTMVVVTLRIDFADSLEFRRAVLEDSLAQGRM